MTLLQILVVLAVIAAVAAVAAGFVRGGMAEPTSSLPLFELPQDRPLTAADLDGVRFSMAPRGYRMTQVDDVLLRLTHELAARDAELARLRGTAEPTASADPTAVPEPAEPTAVPEPADPTAVPEPAEPTGSTEATEAAPAPVAQRDA